MNKFYLFFFCTFLVKRTFEKIYKNSVFEFPSKLKYVPFSVDEEAAIAKNAGI